MNVNSQAVPNSPGGWSGAWSDSSASPQHQAAGPGFPVVGITVAQQQVLFDRLK